MRDIRPRGCMGSVSRALEVRGISLKQGRVIVRDIINEYTL